MTDELDISRCRICSEEIVIAVPSELPLCGRLSCFRIAFPDDYKELIESLKGGGWDGFA